jgi:hypothetical protein
MKDLEQVVVTLDHATWQAVMAKARALHDDPRVWLGRQIEHLARSENCSQSSDAILEDLAMRHFANVPLTNAERQEIGTAMEQIIGDGGVLVIGPFVQSGRRYHIQRAKEGMRISLGAAALELPLALARRVAAGLVDNSRRLGALHRAA